MGITIKPFKGLRVDQDDAEAVLAPPYDVINREEAKKITLQNNHTFLRITRSEIDLDDTVDPYSQEVYQQASKNLQIFIEKNVLHYDRTDCFYLYQLVQGDHTQTGIVGLVSIADYKENKIKKHERTREDKLIDRTQHILNVGAQTGPILMMHRDDPDISNIKQTCCKKKPDIDVVTSNRIRHLLWKIDDLNDIELLKNTFSKHQSLYIADGHHRSEAALQASLKNNTDSFLAMIFPASELQILGYHRVVSDLSGYELNDFLKKLSNDFDIQLLNDPFFPHSTNTFGFYANGSWYRFDLKTKSESEQFDVDILFNTILQPLLNINDPRTDSRLQYIGGLDVIEKIKAITKQNKETAIFTVCPVTVDDIIRVADNNEIMPPKSTWFEPKLADGLVTYVF